ncbi:MAG TPA: hypothetical protein VHX65_05820 [Pirellulales bacterium]|jgi:hypothetical protein|nr:hypothetical protein [Pirellulales bacterium]
MSTFENDNYKWRETYFVLFNAAKRPSLEKMTEALQSLNRRFELSNTLADDDGGFESLTLRSPQDYSALDISYVSGEEVQTQGVELAEEMRPNAADPDERAKLARLPKCDARLDILHFEEIVGGGGSGGSEDEGEETLDPSTLLNVLDALVRMTGGVGVDPQSGSVM